MMSMSLREKDDKLVKIAVVILSAPGKVTQFIEFDQNRTITNVIQDICAKWELPDPENYVLQTFDSKHQLYITDDNKTEIKKGSILRLEVSPAKNAQDILTALNSGSTFDQYAALAKLSYLSDDTIFSEEFFKQDGLTIVMSNIEQGKYTANALKYALNSVVVLMEHKHISWDSLDKNFIHKILYYVNKQPSILDPKVMECCLTILEQTVRNNSKKSDVEKKIVIHNILLHLQNPRYVNNCKLQSCLISLINAIFTKAGTTRKTVIAAMISSKQCRSIIHEYIFRANECPRTISKNSSGTSLIHELYVLQTLLLSLLAPRMRQRADAQEQESLKKIKDLRKIAFGSDLSMKVAMKLGTKYSKNDYKQLGFSEDETQLNVLNQVPPGVLALDCMVYFAKNYSRDYRNIVLKSNSKGDDYPFGKISMELVKLICEILQVGQPPSDQGQNYYPLIFSHEKPFEEMFCVCIVVLNKIWMEMKATMADIDKVMCVFYEHIDRALSCSPKNIIEFRERVSQRSFAEITRLWQRIRNSCRRKIGNFV